MTGASPSGDRAFAAPPSSPAVSPVPASIPSAMRLSETEAETLSAWSECEVGYGFGFRVVAINCKTHKSAIRRSVRALARKGMLEYARALYDEDGKMGAGYTLTKAGSERLGVAEQCAWDAFEAAMLADHASAIEARRAATSGAVHESAVPQADAIKVSNPND